MSLACPSPNAGLCASGVALSGGFAKLPGSPAPVWVRCPQGHGRAAGAWRSRVAETVPLRPLLASLGPRARGMRKGAGLQARAAGSQLLRGPGTRGRPPTPSSRRLTAGGLSRRPASALRAHLLPPRKLFLASYAPREPATFCPTAPPPGSLTPERSARLCADVRRLQGPGKLAVATPTVPRVRPAAPPALWEAPSRSPTELQDEPAACT